MDRQHDRSQSTSADFPENEIDLSHTFVDIAEIDAHDDPSAAARALSKAQEGCDVAPCHGIGTVRDSDELNRLLSKFSTLTARLGKL